MRCGSFFSGIGLLDYGLCLAGFEHAWGCEADEWRRQLWEQRFRAPCHPDIRAFDVGWGQVDVVAGGFPCKGASTAGDREGFGHPETVLWREMARAIRELRPRYVLVENVANILGIQRGAVWGEVLRDLDALGFDVVWDCLPAAAVGAPHRRDRVFAVASLPAGEDSRRSGGVGSEPYGRTDAEGSADGALAVAEGTDGQGPWRGREALGRAQAGAAVAAADAYGDVRDADHGPVGADQPRQARADIAEAAEDADFGSAQPAGGEWRGEPQGTPVAVDWAEYGPAIARWEQVIGRPAGEPLLQGVVARSARGLVRSRLSALGDGVQVQVGYLAGLHIRALEDERMRSAA